MTKNREFLTEVAQAFSEVTKAQPNARREFLSQTYADRPDIVREVESLLDHQADAARFDHSIVVDAAAEMLQDTENVIGSLVGGRYVIRRCIGSGAMAEVYLADHVTLKTPFALKRPLPVYRGDPSYRSRFLAEARRAVLLKHDNVARVHDVINEGQDIFVVMEHVEGETLRSRMNRMERPFSVSEFLPIALQCASALAAAHEKRIVHLDVKPENIMLTPAGQVKICDFGVARRLSSDSSNDTTESADPKWTLAGTPAYMAPEVILSQSFDERADLFSLGTVFYEMLGGRNPFICPTTMSTTARIVSDMPPSLAGPEIDKALAAIVMRMLAKDPAARQASANVVMEQLKTSQRSQHALRDLVGSFREALTKHWRMTAAAIGFVVIVVALPPVWLYRDEIQKRLGLYPIIPEKKVVVVLPFHITGNTRSPYYWTGLTYSLTSALNQLSPRIQVVPAEDVRVHKIATATEAGRFFGANLALTGSIVEDHDRFRISLTLSDTTDPKQLREIPFTIAQSDSVNLESRIIDAAFASLEIELSPAQQDSLKRRGTNTPSAYEFYLQGIGYLATHRLEDADKGIQSFRQALLADSNFGLAYAGLGEAYLTKSIAASKDPRLLDRSQEACEKAVAIDGNLAAGHGCLGRIQKTRGNSAVAVESYQRAIDLNGANDAAYREMAAVYERLGNWEVAEAAYQKAIDVRPDYWGNHIWLASFYMFSRHEYQDAVKLYQKAVDLVPDNPLPRAYLCGAYIFMGRYSDAVESCTRSIALKPEKAAYINLGVAYLGQREFTRAAEAFEHAVALDPTYKPVGHLARAYSWIPERRAEATNLYLKAIGLANEQLAVDPNDPDTNIMVARYHAMVGHRDKALSHLQIALKERPKDPHYQEIAAVIHDQFGERSTALGFLGRAIAGGYSLTEIEAEPELDNLRQTPTIQAQIESVKRKGNRQ